MTDTVRACPHCDAAAVTPYGGGRSQPGNRGHEEFDYVCDRCYEPVEEPVHREPYHDGGQSHRVGLAGVLEETDPDELDGGNHA